MPDQKIFNYDGSNYSYNQIKEIIEKGAKLLRTYSRFVAVMKMVEGKNILDLGCKIGIIARGLAEKGKDVLAIDILPSVIDIARTFNQVEGVKYLCQDIFDLNLSGSSFDCVLFLETIEHINEPSRFLKEIYRILKPGGCLIVSTPNAVSYLNILYQIPIFFKRWQDNFIKSLESEVPNTGTQLDHLFFWDFRTFIRYLTRNGFIYSDHKFVGTPSFNIPFGRVKFNIFKGKELSFFLPFLGPYLANLVIKVRKPNI